MTKLLLSVAIAGMLSIASAKDPMDADFVNKASQAGLAEVALGKDANAQATRDDVKTFAQRMVTDHSKANDALKTVASGAGLPLASEPSDEQKATETRLQGMHGLDFDKAYVTQAVKDQKGAVALFEKESASGNDPALKAFAQQTLPTLKDHLQMAKKLEGSVK